MNNSDDLIDKFFQAINVLTCEFKTEKSYGTKNKLTYSDICFLKCIQRNQNEKAGNLSVYLGMTNGAVTQLAKKLITKGYAESYRLSNNKKEVYYKLTQSGENACNESDRHYDKITKVIKNYIGKLDDGVIEKIYIFFDKVVESCNLNKCCYVKNDIKDNCNQIGVERCEKCKRTC